MSEKPSKKRRSQAITRYNIVGAAMLLFLLVIFIAVFNTIFVEGDKWRAIAKTLHRPEPVQLNPVRGNIYSSDGTILAISAPHYRLYFDFRSQAIQNVPQDSLLHQLDSLATLIAERLSTPDRPLSAKDLRRRWQEGLKKGSRYWPVVVQDISYMDVKELYSMPPLAPKELYNSNGRRTGRARSLLSKSISREERSKRVNPYGSLAARTVGLVYGDKEGGLSRGKNGIELGYDSFLKGEVGEGVRIYNAGQYMTNTITEPIKGADVYMTLNMNMQSVVETALRDMLIKSNAENGSAVLMDVKTGQIRAITNLGRLSEGVYGETMNYAVSDLSEPGSTFKAVSLFVAMADGKCNPTDTVDVDNGMWRVGRHTMRDWTVGKRGGFGRVTIANAFEQSSNVGVAKVIQQAYGSDPARFVELVRATGITDDFKLEIPGYAKARVRLPSDTSQYWSATTLPWMAHGYETNVPPIATLAFYNAIANGGRFVRPYFVSKVMRSGEVIQENTTTIIRDSIGSPHVIAQMQQMLRGVVTDGTAKSAQSHIVNISGKTGTAVISKGYRSREYQISFASFFPSEAPRYSLIVVIRKPGAGYTGAGRVCGEVAKTIAEGIIAMETPRSIDSLRGFEEVMPPSVQGGKYAETEASLQTLHIPIAAGTPQGAIFVRGFTQEDGKIALTNTAPVLHGQVPDVRGIAASDAVYMLAKAGYKSRLIGYGTVKDQNVAPGTKLPVGSELLLRLERGYTPRGARRKLPDDGSTMPPLPKSTDETDEGFTMEQINAANREEAAQDTSTPRNRPKR